MGLKLDYNKLIEDYLKYFYEELDWALKAWEAEVYQKSKSLFALRSRGKKSRLSVETNKTHVKSRIKRERRKIIAYLNANTSALIDSFGTGSLMNITDNPGFKEYFNNKGDGQGQWNPVRHGKTIVGRKKGWYVDLFGRKRHSSGVFEGQSMEGKKFHGFTIEPIPPSNAIPEANKALWNTYIPAAIKNARNRIKFSNYVIEVNK